MKHRSFILLWAVCACILAGCGGASTQKDEHQHAHDEHSDHKHEHEHDHKHDHDHEGEEHDHDYKEDTHEAIDNEIIFTAEQAKAVGLEVSTAEPGLFCQVIKAGGQILSAQGDEVTIAATSNGILSFSGSAVEGVAVRAGEAIASISAKDIANGDPVAQARITYETAEKEFRRAEELVKDQIISTQEFEQVRLRYETAKTAYRAFAGKAGVHGVRLTTPIAGYLKNRFVNQGEFVAVGQPVATVSQNRRLQLRAEVPEKYFRDLQHIGSANFKVSYSDRIYKLSELKGRLLSFGKSAGQASFYVPVTFEFDNIGDIMPGAYAEVYLLSTPRPDVITLPIKAVTEEQGVHFVYVQLDEEGYVKREVTLGADDGERVQILSGIHVGDRVVTQGVYQLKLAANASVIPEGHSHSH